MPPQTSLNVLRRRVRRSAWLTWEAAALVWTLIAALAFAMPAGARSSDDGAGSDPNTIRAAQLPAEAREALQLIRAGGPFPYAKDGIVFGNYERLLPRKPRGYYREYTVPTPGAHDRGTRRIIYGHTGEAYYTDDHYRSFKRIVE